MQNLRSVEATGTEVDEQKLVERTKVVKFSGHSDDTLRWEEVGGAWDDFDNCGAGSPIVFKVSVGEEGLLVYGQYGVMPGGTWGIGISQLDEDIPIPDWALKASLHTDTSGYSPVLSLMEVPRPAKIERLHQ